MNRKCVRRQLRSFTYKYLRDQRNQTSMQLNGNSEWDQSQILYLMIKEM